MKKLTPSENEKSFLNIIAIIVAVSQLLLLIWPPDLITNFIAKYPRWLFLAIIFALALGYLFAYYLSPSYSKEEFSSIEKKQLNNLCNQSRNLKRYSVVFVDDMFEKATTLTDFKDRLDNYNILLLPSVSNMKLLIGFDVIILDIIGAGDKLGSTTIIQELFEAYPYKYIIALTSNAAAIHEMQNICKVVSKPSCTGKTFVDKLIETLQKELKEAFDLLDKPERFWESIERRFNEEQKPVLKRRFEHHIIDSGLYTLNK